MKKETKGNVFRWIKFASFVLVIIGGLNMLLMGLFNFDIIGGLLGGSSSVAARVLYSLFGLGAVTLLTVVLIKVFAKPTKEQQAEQVTEKSA